MVQIKPHARSELQQSLRELCSRPGGASLDEVMACLGVQERQARNALSNHQRNHHLYTVKEVGNRTRYFVHASDAMDWLITHNRSVPPHIEQGAEAEARRLEQEFAPSDVPREIRIAQPRIKQVMAGQCPPDARLPMRPGAGDALRLPSRRGDRLHYRDGRVTDLAGNPITEQVAA